jgi:serine/threonine-protein kinase SRPK3
MSGATTPTLVTPYETSEDLKQMQWPDENLTFAVGEDGGFCPAELGESFDDGRFVVTRKLGWGGFASVWLARDLQLQIRALPYFQRCNVMLP